MHKQLDLTKFGFPVHSVLVEENGLLLQESYFAPYCKTELHRMFSVTKSYCALAIGALVAEKKLALTDRITSFFPEYTPKNPHPYLQAMTIQDMLRMQTCHASTTYKLHSEQNWVESFFITAPDHAPGQIFNYDTSSSHTLAALVKKLSGKGVLDYLRGIYLDALGFSTDAYIIPDPFGSEMGGSGLMARSRDLLTTMRLVMDLSTGRFFTEKSRLGINNARDSAYCRAQYATLITPQYNLAFWQRYATYLKEAVAYHVPTCHSGQTVDEQQGYGYQFWQLRGGASAMYGMGGQYAIMYPHKELLVIITADTQNIKGGTQFLLNAVYDYVYHTQNSVSYELLQKTKRCTEATGISLYGHYTLVENASGFTELELTAQKLTLCQRVPYSALSEAELRSARTAAANTVKTAAPPTSIVLEDDAVRFVYAFSYDSETPQQSKTARYQQNVYTTGKLQPDGSLYLNVQILDEYVGSIHFLLHAKNHELCMYIRKIEESYFKEFSGFYKGVRS